MGSPVHRVPSRYYAVLGEILRAQTPDYERLLASFNIDIQSLQDPNGTLTIAELEALIDVSSRMTGRGDLGFELGQQVRLNSHGPLGYAFLSSSSLDKALRLCVRYFHLIAPIFRVHYERHSQYGEITVTPCAVMQQRTLQFFLEAHAISFHAQAQMLLGPDNEGYDIYLSMEAPPHVQRYHSNAPARFHFSNSQKPGVTIRIATSLLDRPLPMADESVVRQAEAQCQALSRNPPPTGGWGDFIAMMLRESKGFQLTLEDVARSLNITRRTIHRYLASENLNFRDISQRVRFERACELLDARELNVSQIALLLGFTDVASFSRGFRRYTGVSPSDYAIRRLRTEA
ncbi:putative HTH-type transcriptional regulator [Paraburkholderia nemoris]|uniref:AraC family transcriptional regulator n=1 Tax=Paraburkholderia nemoris TaxID=2793076 RepID=UPI00190C99DF|nr:AraC family transcriptional regulator [Paraburkholderia nemoris]MBK3785708.1 AraC family transcriptional regulator [Paraburkholderia aspalathi]CAE6817863.1 putative HTH-type transcriptional regulator [Paraburkholderia nemoris]